jgi:response regulator RpfG family c-di-GMP phosphodiesterase
MEHNKLILELEELKKTFDTTIKYAIRDARRQEKIMARSDKRQRREYDELQQKLEEIQLLNEEIEESQREVLFTLGAIGESRSRETFNHVKRVAEYSKLIALKLGLDSKSAELLKMASPMHDIGKVGIPDAVLNKPGKLTTDEFEIMKTHAVLGYEMLNVSTRPLLKAAAIVAHEHHEKFDGTGYPRGLKGKDIHVYGRITAIADVFDALGSDRCYKKAWADEDIFEFIKKLSGIQFDPEIVDIFFDNLNSFLEIRDKFKDE